MHGHTHLPSFLPEGGTLMKRATYVAIGVALLLMILKTYAWWHTRSLSLLSTLIDSTLDMAASTINLWAIHRALQPANRHYRFGQTKVEALAALGQSLFMGGSAALLLYNAGCRLINPAPLEDTQMGIGVMLVATLLTAGLVAFQRYVIQQTQSLAIKADALHYKSDLLMNLGVIITLYASDWLNNPWLDPAFAAAIAFYIIYTSWAIARDAVDVLMDRELPEAIRTQVRDLALAHPQVQGVHDLRTRSGGTRQFIQLHLELDGNMTLHEAHKIADTIEQKIEAALPNTEVIIHQDPLGERS